MKFTASQIIQGASEMFFTGKVIDIYKLYDEFAGYSIRSSESLGIYLLYKEYVAAKFPELNIEKGELKELFDSFAVELSNKSDKVKKSICRTLVVRLNSMFPGTYEIPKGAMR